MSTAKRTITKAEAFKVLRRVGIPEEIIATIGIELSDPIDLDRDQAVLGRYGITHQYLIDRMGGSP
jgi:hypothetical protein